MIRIEQEKFEIRIMREDDLQSIIDIIRRRI